MIYKQCVLTIANNTATLDEDIYLYRLDKNVELYFTIVNNKYKFDKSDLNNIISMSKASYFQMRLYKNAEVKYTFAIQPTDKGQAILTITDDLIDEPIEVGDYDFQISLLDADKSSMVSMPIAKQQIHVCEPLVADASETGSAVLGLSQLDTTGEIVDAFDDNGNYIRKVHVNGEIISAELFNKWETALETNTKNIVQVKENQIKLIEDDTSMEGISDSEHDTLTTENKKIIPAINEVNDKVIDIANLSLTKHTDGKVYIKKQDGTLLGDGIEIGGSDVDLSKITMSMSGQTLKLMNDGNQIATVEIPTATVTDAQLTSIIQAKIDDGTLSALSIENRSIDESKLKLNTIHKYLLDDELKTRLSNSEMVKLNKEYPSNYTQATINNDGTLNTRGIAYVTEFLKCYPNEVLDLSKPVHNKVAFYNKSKIFISITTITNTNTNYTVPNDAYYFRLESDYNGGTPALITIRTNKFKNKTFKDLVCSPLKCKPKIQIAGDSNTYGYGLSSTSLSWANLFISQLQTLTTFKYFPNSKWVISRGANSYDINYNFKQYSSMEIDTDAENVTLSIGTNYDSAWKWYIDGITNSSNDNQSTIALDGNLHTVKVEFTAGQAVLPFFQITKSIECKNNAVSGVGTSNVTIETGYDWLLLMVGTNNRNKNNLFFQNYNQYKYCGKATYIVPFPTWKIEEGYTASLMQMATNLIESFKDMGFNILNCLDVASAVFCDTTKYYQGDLIHFNENGHKLICNIISAKLGLPTYLPFNS